MVDALREMAGLLALVAVVLSIVALIIAARRRGAPADEAAARIAPDPVLDQRGRPVGEPGRRAGHFAVEPPEPGARHPSEVAEDRVAQPGQ